MVGKRIIWSFRANFELKNILEYYTKRNGNSNYSIKILNEIEDLMNILSKSKFIGRLTSNKTTRAIPMKVYLIFYEINENQIEIVSFWDNRQNQQNRIVE